MTSVRYHPWLHRFAIVTGCVALGTMLVGALVTSKNAGMAFRDWPSSDGHSMLSYPWLRSSGDKFLEHGHRLAGVTIGLFSIALCGLIAGTESRRWVKVAGVLVLLSVIVQGILGGFRVWLDERGLALVHGAFAAWVFALIGSVALFLSRGWLQAAERHRHVHVESLPPLAVGTVVVLLLQYLLGGLIRHQGTALNEHVVLGVAALLVVLGNALFVQRSRVRWLQSSAWLLLGLVVVQAALGGGAWVAKFGFAATGYVAIADSIQQVGLRTAHTLVGILVFMTAVVHAARVLRVAHVAQPVQASIGVARATAGLTAGGGAA